MTPPETPDCNRDAPASFAAPAGSAFPLKLIIMVEATNGSTTLKGVDEISRLLRAYTFPKQGQNIQTNYYRVTVVEVVDRLPNVKDEP